MVHGPSTVERARINGSKVGFFFFWIKNWPKRVLNYEKVKTAKAFFFFQTSIISGLSFCIIVLNDDSNDCTN